MKYILAALRGPLQGPGGGDFLKFRINFRLAGFQKAGDGGIVQQLADAGAGQRFRKLVFGRAQNQSLNMAVRVVVGTHQLFGNFHLPHPVDLPQLLQGLG